MRRLALIALPLIAFAALADPVPYPPRPKCSAAARSAGSTGCNECKPDACAELLDAGYQKSCVTPCGKSPCPEVWCTTKGKRD